MRKNMWYSLFFAIIVSLSLIACNDQRDTDRDNDGTADNQETTRDANPPAGNGTTGNVGNTGTGMDGQPIVFWNTDRDYTYAERDEYKEQLEASVERLDNEIDRLEDKADDATGETKQAIESRIDQLEKKRTEIKNKMNDWAHITEGEWNEFKSDMKSTWGDVQNSYNEVVRDISDDDDKGTEKKY